MGCMKVGALIETGGLLVILRSSPPKAFDCLPHRLSLAKLKASGLSEDSILLMESYLSDRFQRGKVGDTFSDWLRVVKGALISCLNYSPIIWHYCGKRNSDKLEWINESCLCFIFNDCHSSYDKLLDNINCPSLPNRRIRDMLTLVYKSFHGLAPSYINELLIERNSSYNLCGKHSLSVPRVQLTKYGLHSFRYSACKYWNMLLGQRYLELLSHYMFLNKKN